MRTGIVIITLLAGFSTSHGQTVLKYVPAPVDNPLKGLVPYAGEKREMFPHSMEFTYLPLSKVFVGKNKYDWRPLEKILDDIASRGHQSVFRFWMEYPGHKDGVPQFLEDDGVKVTEWMNTNTAPFPEQEVRTPDYNDPRLQKALVKFIAEFGRRYDGDPRIGFLTAGLIGTWGEWHTYPRTDLMPGKPVQVAVMDAYEEHFSETPVLLRYPAGKGNYHYAENHDRRLGYHDDSFAWATLDTGRKEDNWYFVPALEAAGPAALNRWQTQPIGGEIRPEVWGQIFDNQPAHEKAQDFRECVTKTHASWLLDTGMFQAKQSAQRLQNAKRQVQQMGYEFHVAKASCQKGSSNVTVKLQLKNSGVAPFYHPWKWQVGACVDGDEVVAVFSTDQTVLQILPDANREFQFLVPVDKWPAAAKTVVVRVANPMEQGLPLRFANERSLQLEGGWFKVGKLAR